jgi:hypothetical protein
MRQIFLQSGFSGRKTESTKAAQHALESTFVDSVLPRKKISDFWASFFGVSFLVLSLAPHAIAVVSLGCWEVASNRVMKPTFDSGTLSLPLQGTAIKSGLSPRWFALSPYRG